MFTCNSVTIWQQNVRKRLQGCLMLSLSIQFTNSCLPADGKAFVTAKWKVSPNDPSLLAWPATSTSDQIEQLTEPACLMLLLLQSGSSHTQIVAAQQESTSDISGLGSPAPSRRQWESTCTIAERLAVLGRALTMLGRANATPSYDEHLCASSQRLVRTLMQLLHQLLIGKLRCLDMPHS